MRMCSQEFMRTNLLFWLQTSWNLTLILYASDLVCFLSTLLAWLFDFLYLLVFCFQFLYLSLIVCHVILFVSPCNALFPKSTAGFRLAVFFDDIITMSLSLFFILRSIILGRFLWSQSHKGRLEIWTYSLPFFVFIWLIPIILAWIFWCRITLISWSFGAISFWFFRSFSNSILHIFVFYVGCPFGFASYILFWLDCLFKFV